ncbi:hypothetical protein [Sorangium sp. So ce1153]|uniref:hypothetical protein n=1 Tax=Sorangium sp. So ce1153 TaxID=3133333 RepID=UPI003F5E9CC5
MERCDAADDENCDGLECIVWTTAYEQTGDVHFMDIARDADGSMFVSGAFLDTITIGGDTLSSASTTDILLLKLSPTGEPVWAKKFGDNVVVVGDADTQIDFGNGPLALTDDSGFVVKLSPDAELVWHRFLGKDALPYAVASSPDGETLVTGWTRAPDADWGAGPLPGAGDDGHQRLVIAKLGR